MANIYSVLAIGSIFKSSQYSCLENPMDGGAWWAAVHGVAKNRTRLSDFTFTFHFHALEKEMATHSSVLAWGIPGTAGRGGLLSMGSHRVGHNWSDLAAAAFTSLYLCGNYLSLSLFCGGRKEFHAYHRSKKFYQREAKGILSGYLMLQTMPNLNDFKTIILEQDIIDIMSLLDKMGWHSIESGVFVLRIHNLSIIIKKHQT